MLSKPKATIFSFQHTAVIGRWSINGQQQFQSRYCCASFTIVKFTPIMTLPQQFFSRMFLQQVNFHSQGIGTVWVQDCNQIKFFERFNRRTRLMILMVLSFFNMSCFKKLYYCSLITLNIIIVDVRNWVKLGIRSFVSTAGGFL